MELTVLFLLSSDLSYIHQTGAEQRFINVLRGARCKHWFVPQRTRCNFEGCTRPQLCKTRQRLQPLNTRGSEINGNFQTWIERVGYVPI